MKQLILIYSLMYSINIMAQTPIKTAVFSVKGNFNECKERIENATDIKGVKNAIWDKDKQSITVTYNSNKITLEQIEKAIAKSGHTTSTVNADSTAYAKLPECCKYQSAECKKK